MSEDEESALTKKFHRELGKWLIPILLLVGPSIFGAGVWATTMTFKFAAQEQRLSDLQKGQDILLANDADQAKALANRLEDWGKWRREVEDFMHQGGRFVASDWDMAAYIFNATGPKIPLPYFWQIQKARN